MHPARNILKILLFLLVLQNCLTESGVCDDRTGNRLIHESSPYLLKHATNPVDWYPWGDEAFARAREQNRPVFLSIGYLTCHWCNVMEEESFADPEVAGLINDLFIPIKVDREERPDIDQVYMKACRLLSPSCGWPLTVFLTPAGKPFYVGTYIPKHNRFGRTGLLELIPRVKQLWADEQDSVLKSANSINAAMVSSTLLLPGSDMKPSMLETGFLVLERDFDQEHGGFGSGMKFPKPLNLLYLLRYWQTTGRSESLAMVEKTLTAMRIGGIYDQLGFGFHRYTTDPMWHLPHFEKMLYDQALLIMAYVEAYQATADAAYAQIARETIRYVLENLASEDGAFYSAESADSNQVEGGYYLWTMAEINNALDVPAAAAVKKLFHLEQEGNFIDPVTGRKTGKNVLYAGPTEVPGNDSAKIREQLLRQREKRTRPVLDDKVLTDWNGLMIASLARAARVLDQPEYGLAARKTARFILKNLKTGDGRLLHRWRNGEAGLEGSAADYSFFIWGLLELYGWDFDSSWLGQSLDFTEILFSDFWDEKLGGFYLTVDKKQSLLPRIKEDLDSAVPSSNSAAMLNLLKLSRLTGNIEFENKAAAIGRLLSSSVEGAESAFPMLLTALNFALAPSQEVVIVGKRHAADTELMLAALRTKYIPNTVVLFKPAEESTPAINTYAGYTEFMQPINDMATAYVCTNFTCSFPTNDPAVMLTNLSAIQGNKPTD